jgi:hypothetical protein
MKRHCVIGLGLVGLFSCASVTAKKAATTAPVVAPTLAEREDLPLEAREVLTARMLRHGDQMGALSIAVVLLDYEVVQLLAERMVEEPVLGRPLPGDDKSLNAMLPKSFFVHQDALSEATRALAKAARQKDDQKLAETYFGVAQSCVDCHSAYLHDELTTELGLPCELDGECDEEDEPESGWDPDL